MVLYSTSGDSVIKIGQTHNPFKKMKKGTYRLLFSDIFIICGSRNNFYFLQKSEYVGFLPGGQGVGFALPIGQ